MATDYEVNALIKMTDEVSGKLGPINQGFGGMATKIGLATGALAAFALKAGNEFDTARATIAEGTGAIGPKLDGLTASFQNIGAIAGAGGLQATATAVADLNTHMGLTGPELEEIATKALQAGIDTNNFGSFVRAAGLDAQGASTLLDQLKVASQNTGVSMDQLVGATNRMSGRMTAAGVPMNDQLALVVQLASEGGGYSALRSKLSEVATQIDQGNIPAISNLTTQLGNTEGAVVSTYGETVTFTEKLSALKDEFLLAVGPFGNVVGSLASMLTPILLLIPQLPLLAAGFRTAWLAIAGPAAIAAAGIIAVGAAAWTFRDNLANALAWVIDKILVPWASTFLQTAESAFSWVPGLGGKLRTARLAVKDFGDRSSGYLRDFASDMGKAETATDDLDTAVAGLSGPAGALGDLADDADAAAGALTGDNGMVAGLAAAEEAARLAKIEIDKIKLDEQELGRNGKQAMTNFSNAVKNWVTDNNVPDDVLMPPPPPLSATQEHERRMGEVGADGMKEFARLVRLEAGTMSAEDLAPGPLLTDVETSLGTLGTDAGTAFKDDLKEIVSPTAMADIFTAAFTGGGGVLGALQGIGSQLLGAITDHFLTPLTNKISEFAGGFIDKLFGGSTGSAAAASAGSATAAAWAGGSAGGAGAGAGAAGGGAASAGGGGFLGGLTTALTVAAPAAAVAGMLRLGGVIGPSRGKQMAIRFGGELVRNIEEKIGELPAFTESKARAIAEGWDPHNATIYAGLTTYGTSLGLSLDESFRTIIQPFFTNVEQGNGLAVGHMARKWNDWANKEHGPTLPAALALAEGNIAGFIQETQNTSAINLPVEIDLPTAAEIQAALPTGGFGINVPAVVQGAPNEPVPGAPGGHSGGVFHGPETGYAVNLHGTETVVPGAHPQLVAAGGGSGGNIIINVDGASTQDGTKLAKKIVQVLQRQGVARGR